MPKLLVAHTGLPWSGCVDAGLRWVIESRDQFTDERLEMLGGDMKLGECYQIGLCSLTCPKGLNPRAALKHLKDLYADYEERKSTEQVTI